MTYTSDLTLQDGESIQLMEQSLEVPIYNKRKIILVEGKGSIVWDINGKKYIDCIAGIGVANIGHQNSFLIDAILRQANRMITCPEIFYNDTRANLLHLLNKITPQELTQFYLCNSGTEAVEAAIKFARSSTGKTDFISMVRGFHGRTFGSLSSTFDKTKHKQFQPLLPGFSFASYNRIEKVKQLISENTAGIIVELVQGNGGVHIADRQFIKDLRKLCDLHNIVLIFDEIQTGFGRTGKMFAFEHYDVVPDILCMAKAMGGGIPIGAVVCNRKIDLELTKHGTTFGGNPLSCAASIAAISFLIDHKLAQNASEKGEYLVAKLMEIKSPMIRKIRHLGLIIGIECKQKVGSIINELQDKGILVNSAGSKVIRLLPPLTISYEELDHIANVMKDVLEK